MSRTENIDRRTGKINPDVRCKECANDAWVIVDTNGRGQDAARPCWSCDLGRLVNDGLKKPYPNTGGVA